MTVQNYMYALIHISIYLHADIYLYICICIQLCLLIYRVMQTFNPYIYISLSLSLSGRVDGWMVDGWMGGWVDWIIVAMYIYIICTCIVSCFSILRFQYICLCFVLHYLYFFFLTTRLFLCWTFLSLDVLFWGIFEFFYPTGF